MYIGGLQAQNELTNEVVHSRVFTPPPPPSPIVHIWCDSPPIVHLVRQLFSVHYNAENWTKNFFSMTLENDLYLDF